MISLQLSAEVQGYWFSFVSLAALAIFADLGFTTILLQFSAHEFAFLKFNNEGKLEGDKARLTRIATLFRFSLKWSSLMGVVVFPVILAVGYYVLDSKVSEVDWVLPWLIYSVSAVFVFINNTVLSFLEGCNSVGSIQKLRLQTSIVNIIVMLIGLMFGWELYALAAGLASISVATTLLVLLKYRHALRDLLFISQGKQHTWGKEIFTLLWRYAISWSSGYFIFQIFTPLSFAYYGALEAGQVGMSFSICTAIYGVANIWMIMILPKINMLVAEGDYYTLEPLFKKHLIYAVFTYVVLVVGVFSTLFILKEELPLLSRIVSPLSFLILSMGWLFQIIINGYAVYLRAHKKEPLVMLSLCMGGYIAFISWFAATNLPFEYLFVGFLSSYVFALPWLFVINKNFIRRVA
ncbi:MAG: hypothetical protein R8M14_01930 [Ghiorsea sp.]